MSKVVVMRMDDAVEATELGQCMEVAMSEVVAARAAASKWTASVAVTDGMSSD